MASTKYLKSNKDALKNQEIYTSCGLNYHINLDYHVSLDYLDKVKSFNQKFFLTTNYL